MTSLPKRVRKARNNNLLATEETQRGDKQVDDDDDDFVESKQKPMPRTAGLKQGTLEDQDGCSGEFYEYLDHTADVQLHAWGIDLKSTFEHLVPCMFNYMTDIRLVEEQPNPVPFSADGHDLESLLFKFLDELLWLFSSEGFCCCRCDIREFNLENFHISANLFGEPFDRRKHTSGTEIKAITFSNMQIHQQLDLPQPKCDIYVIVDI